MANILGLHYFQSCKKKEMKRKITGMFYKKVRF